MHPSPSVPPTVLVLARPEARLRVCERLAEAAPDVTLVVAEPGEKPEPGAALLALVEEALLPAPAVSHVQPSLAVPFAVLLAEADPDRERAWLRAGALDVFSPDTLTPEHLQRLLDRAAGLQAGHDPALPVGLYRHLFDRQHHFLALLDDEGRILDLNQYARSWLGAFPSPIGCIFWESAGWTDPDRVASRMRRALRRAAARTTTHFESTLTLPRRGRLPLRFTVQQVSGPPQDGPYVFLVEGQPITEQKRIEEALRASQAIIRSAFDHAPIGKALVTPKGIIQEANEALARFFGHDRLDLIGRPLDDFTPPDGRGKERVLIEAVLEGERESFQIEKPFLHDGEELRWGLMSVTAITARSSSKLLVVQIQDITERKRYEEALRASQLLNAGILASLPDLIAVLNDRGEIVAINQAWETKAQERNAPLTRTGLGVNYLELCRQASNEDDVARRALEGIEAVLQGQQPAFEMEYPCHTEDAPAWYAMKVVPFRERSGVVIAHTDITRRYLTEQQLRQSEERYRMLFESVQDAIVVVDAETLRIVDANESAQTMYGYSLEELRRMKAPDLSADPEQARQTIEHVKRQDRPTLFLNQGRHRRKDGSTFHVEISSGMLNMGGQRLISAVIRDVTQRYEAERMLRQSRKQLRLLAARLQAIREEERTRLSRQVHDVLGQALTGLRMDISMIERQLDTPPPAIQQRLDLMKQSVDETVQVVRRIAADLRPGLLDDLGLTAALQWELQKFEQRTGITCTFEDETDEVSLAPDQATAVYRVVQELLTNVARHAGATSVHLHVRQTEEHLEIRLQDNGKGISEQALSESRSLGILGMRERLLPWSGQLCYESRPGKGTTAIVTLLLHATPTQLFEEPLP